MTRDRVRAWLSAPEHVALVAIVAVAGALRLAWFLYAKSEPPTVWYRAGDQYAYYYFGSEMAAGRGYHNFLTGEPTAYWPVGYPATLAALFWVALHTPISNDLMLVAGLFHVVISTATVALVYVIGRAVFSPKVGLLAAAVLALFPNVIYQSATLQLETTFMFLTMAALAIIVTHDWSRGLPSRPRLLAFGAVLGASALVRPFSVWFVLGVFAAALTIRAGWWRSALTAGLPVLVVGLLSVPWIIRNLVVMDAFIPSSTNMGDGLCIDRNMDAEGGFRWAAHDGCADPGLHEVERNRANTKKAISFVVHHPAKELWLIGKRTQLMMASDHDGIEAVQGLDPDGPQLGAGLAHRLGRGADWYFRGVLVASIAGLPLLLLRRRPRLPERRILLGATVALLAVPALLWGNPRFHLPLVPLMAILVAALAGEVLERVAARRRRAEPLEHEPPSDDATEAASAPSSPTRDPVAAT